MLRYLNYLRTGSGSDEIALQIEDAAAEINIRRNWMGSGLQRYKLACRQQTLSTSFGLFVVERVEAAKGEDGPWEVVELDEEDALLPLVIEYVTVSTSPVYVHDHCQLAMIRPLGYASWNESFELVLMVHEFEDRATKWPLVDICDAIDKKKFVAWSEEMAAKRAAQEAADAETSLKKRKTRR